MKTRIISAIVMLLIVIPVIWVGHDIYAIGVYVVSLLGLHEMVKLREEKKKYPYFIKFIMYIIFTFLVLDNHTNRVFVYAIDYRLIACMFFTLFIPVVLYHDKKTYDINDALYLIGTLFFLGIAFNSLILIRNYGLVYLVYLLLITIVTDTYAFLFGLLVGKHKLLEAVSPKKTWEGMIGGTFFGVLIGTLFYHYAINPELSIVAVGFLSLLLSVIGQFGDLFFSAIKRFYNKKDFSNLIPGHGGILDRLDSIIFVVLGFVLFLTIL